MTEETPESQESQGSPEPATGRIRRLRGRRVDATVTLAVLLPLVAVVALVLTRPHGWTTPVAAPTDRPIEAASVVCPSAATGKDTVAVLSASGDGAVSLTPGGGGRARTLDLTAGAPTTLQPDRGPQVVSATGAPAAGLVAGRWSAKPLAATDCPVTDGDQWFSGLGSGAVHDSVVELTNPSDGEAVVDLGVFTAHGQRDVPRLRGIALAPHTTKSFDLLDFVPQQGPLAVHATVIRGQVAISARDQSRALTGEAPHEDWMAGQSTARERNLLLGIVPDGGTHTVYVANPTGRQLSVSVQLVTADSVLTPAGAPTVDVAPETVTSFSLDKLLAAKVADGALGVEIRAGGPVAVALRRTTSTELTTVASGSHVHQATAVLVPPGDKHLVLAGASGVGAVTVVARDADGKQLDSQRVAVQPQQGASVDLPEKAVALEVTPENTSIVGSVVVTSSDGSAVIPLRDLVRHGRIPAVRPGLR